MAVPFWQPGTQHQPGDLVRPTQSGPVVVPNLANLNFEAGDTGWDTSGAWEISAGSVYQGTVAARIFEVGNDDDHVLTNNVNVPTAPGIPVSARGYALCSANASGGRMTTAHLRIVWLDSSEQEISVTDGPQQTAASAWNFWAQMTVNGVAPPGAAFWTLAVVAWVGGTGAWVVDQFTVDYAFAASPVGLIFRAVQEGVGFSGNSEPQWPTELAQQVVDNTVTWEAVSEDRLVWEAHRILVSGQTEPEWPEQPGANVADNTISWEAITRRVEDDKNPRSPIVAIASSKVFAADGDIVAFSATVNPLDWSSQDDAGYLPYGLQTYGANPITAMALYRGNVVVFNSQGSQIWQVDEDPQGMALLDAVPIGCTFPKSLAPVMNDLVLLTDRGIRNMGTVGAAVNLQAGDFGKPIDPLVLTGIKQKVKAEGIEPRALYWPAAGQYWLFFGAEAFVLTINGTGKHSRSWSRYIFPAAIDDWTLLGDDLYLRAGDTVWVMDDEALMDDEHLDTEVVEYTEVGDDAFEVPAGVHVLTDVLVVAQGGGTADASRTGGGGGGGVRHAANVPVTPGQIIALEVGSNPLAQVGADSFFGDIVATGGGRGRGFSGTDAASADGGSGGGGGFSFSSEPGSGIPGQGHDGGTGTTITNVFDAATAGGGGAGAPGQDAHLSVPANGGDGLYFGHIFGDQVGDEGWFGGGGAGRAADSSVGNGGKGGGAGQGNGMDGAGGGAGQASSGTRGGTGAVIVKYSPAGAETLGEPFDAIVQYPHLDLGQLGTEKNLVGLDLVGEGEVTISIGYDQRQPDYDPDGPWTAEYTLEDADTLAGQLIPFPVSGPSFSLRMRFPGGQKWKYTAANLYLNDSRVGA